MEKLFKLVNNELIELTAEEVVERIKEEEENLKNYIPLASGREIVSYAERMFAEQPWGLRKQLQILFISTGLKPVLESETCNPAMKKTDFDDMIKDLENTKELNSDQKQLFLGLVTQYSQERRFI